MSEPRSDLERYIAYVLTWFEVHWNDIDRAGIYDRYPAKQNVERVRKELPLLARKIAEERLEEAKWWVQNGACVHISNEAGQRITDLERNVAAKQQAILAEAEKEPRDEQERDYGATMYQLGRKHMREELEPERAIAAKAEKGER